MAKRIKSLEDISHKTDVFIIENGKVTGVKIGGADPVVPFNNGGIPNSFTGTVFLISDGHTSPKCDVNIPVVGFKTIKVVINSTGGTGSTDQYNDGHLQDVLLYKSNGASKVVSINTNVAIGDYTYCKFRSPILTTTFAAGHVQYTYTLTK